MADRVLTWHEKNIKGNDTRIGPTYYMDADYAPKALRIHVEHSPVEGDVEVEIFKDGKTIFGDRASKVYYSGKGVTLAGIPQTTAVLARGDNYEVDAEVFLSDLILEEGSWVHCEVKKYHEAKNISVHLELEKLSEDESDD